MYTNKEGGNLFVVILGIVLILFILGFFTSDRGFWDTFNFKSILRLPCGVTVQAPKLSKGEKIEYPLEVNGYINGCGWERNGTVAGTVQIMDGRGRPITNSETLIIPKDSVNKPYYFSAKLYPRDIPQTDAGSILLTSTTGLMYAVPVSF